MVSVSAETARTLLSQEAWEDSIRTAHVASCDEELVVPIVKHKIEVVLDESVALELSPVSLKSFETHLDHSAALLIIQTKYPSRVSSPDFVRVPELASLLSEYFILDDVIRVLIPENPHDPVFVGNERPIMRLSQFLTNPHATFAVTDILKFSEVGASAYVR